MQTLKLAAVLALGLVASLPAAQDQALLRSPDVIFVPTPPSVVQAMLEAVNVTAADVVYDLGSGDGRIPIAAARDFGARAVGIEIDPIRIREAELNAQEAGVTDRVEFRTQDLFTADISEATVVTLYLLPSLNEQLWPKLNAELQPGTRVVSHEFPVGDRQPDEILNVNGRRVLLFTVPLQ